MGEEKDKAIVLLSGGVDSTTCLAMARDQGYALYALSFRYGQRHLRELDGARRIGVHFGVERHIVVDFDMRTIGGSALTGDGDVPKGRSDREIGHGVPVTYVPARNTIFLAFSLAWAEVIGARNIFIGVNALDYSGYPDCRPEYIQAFQNVAELATKSGVEGRGGVRIHTPLIRLTKAEIIKKGAGLGVDFSMTHSCYDPPPDGPACGRCDSCLLRRKGFAEAGLEDPIAYPD
jgi:7-cyano-7-deazaguanine synthase